MRDDVDPGVLVEEVVERTGYGAILDAEGTDEAWSRRENLAELAGAAAEYETLEGFLERMALVADSDELDLALDRLRDTGKRLLFVFSEKEPFHEELERQGRLNQGDRWPNLELDLISGRDHTLRPLYSQRHAHEALDRALDRELALMASRAPNGNASLT